MHSEEPHGFYLQFIR